MTYEQLRNLNTIVETYGVDPQVDMCLEKCAELQKALLKYRRGGFHKHAFGSDRAAEEEKARRTIIDELADVSVMVEQMKIIYGYVETEDRIDFMISRQMERLRDREIENVKK